MIKKNGPENIESQRLFAWTFKIKITAIEKKKKSSRNLLSEVLKLNVNFQIFQTFTGAIQMNS